MVRPLTEAQKREIELLIRDPKYGSSDRGRDRARDVLKRRGMIRFNRKAWQWEVLPAGRAALGGQADD